MSGARRGTSDRLAENNDISVVKIGRTKVVSVAWLEAKLGVERGVLDRSIDGWHSLNGKLI